MNKVIYIDDNEKEHVIFSRLYRKDFQVTTVKPENDYVNHINSLVKEYDSIILDYRLNEKINNVNYDASVIIDYIERTYNGYPYYILTAYSGEEDTNYGVYRPEVLFEKSSVISTSKNEKFIRTLNLRITNFQKLIDKKKILLMNAANKYPKITNEEIINARDTAFYLESMNKLGHKIPKELLSYNALSELISIHNELKGLLKNEDS